MSITPLDIDEHGPDHESMPTNLFTPNEKTQDTWHDETQASTTKLTDSHQNTTQDARTPATQRNVVLSSDENNESSGSWTGNSGKTKFNFELTTGILFVISVCFLIAVIILAAILGSYVKAASEECVTSGAPTSAGQTSTATEITSQDEVDFHPITLTLSDTYDPELADPDSAEFAKREKEVCDQVIAILVLLGEPDVLGCVVESFQSGSTKVDLTLVSEKDNGLTTEKIKTDVNSQGPTEIINFQANSADVLGETDIANKTTVLKNSQKSLVDDCAPNPCLNGGTCYDGTNDYICECASGYNGKVCSEEVDCVADACSNHGDCIERLEGGKYCICEAGYTGDSCETDVDECEDSPCVNGNCTQGVGTFTCNCTDGYNGTRCEYDTDDCAGSPCGVNGVCEDQVDGYICLCNDGYEGTNCESATIECTPNPCLNGGNCVEGDNSFTCTCVTGYSGDTCGTNVDDCAAAGVSPCGANGACVDGVNEYHCLCDDGYVGDACELDIFDPCEWDDDPCNGRGCEDDCISTTSNRDCTTGPNYYCDCIPPWSGDNCEIPPS